MGQLKTMPDFDLGTEKNDKNIYWVDTYVSGSGASTVYESRKISEADLKEVIIGNQFYIGLNFEDKEDWNYVAPEKFKITSVDNPDVITYTIKVNGSAYTLGATIDVYDKVLIEVTSIGFLKLNCELV